MSGVVIYSANIGGRDFPHSAVEQDIDVDWRYFTDQPDIPIDGPWKVNEVVSREHYGDEHPNMTAKWWKTHPLSTYEHAIWIDASMEITSQSFAREAIAALNGAPLATFKHPRRSTIAAEAEASLGAEAQGGRYDALPLREQVLAYRDEGFPDNVGLFACGTIVWTWAARGLGEIWWQECKKWGYQDQISFPVACWRTGIAPAVFPIPQIESRNPQMGYLSNRWFRIWPHTKGTD